MISNFLFDGIQDNETVVRVADVLRSTAVQDVWAFLLPMHPDLHKDRLDAQSHVLQR